MRRAFVTTLITLVLATAAHAHFVFVVPDATGNSAKAVFSEDLEPDAAVDIAGIAPTKLYVRATGQGDAPIEWKKGEHEFTFTIPGSGQRTVFGTTNYGVMQRGATKPFLLQYHPKSLIGDFGTFQPLGDAVPVEVIPEKTNGAIRFAVLARGKPLANADATILVPGEKAKKVKTDDKGHTPEFKATGQYGVWARFAEPTAGEHGGKKYEEIRHYATLVVTFGSTVQK